MPNLCLFFICCTPLRKSNYLIHMYYIFIYKIYIYKYFKEKRKHDYKGTTPTTSLNPLPVAGNLLYPHHFYKGTTRVQLPATFCFFHQNYLYLLDLYQITNCCRL